MARNAASKRRGPGFKMVVPLDTSAIDAAEPEQELRVVAQLHDGTLIDQVVNVSAAGTTDAELTFDSDPGSARVFVGPAELGADELVKTDTISRTVARAAWTKPRRAALDAITIAPYYWYWWPRWCRYVTLRGRVVCPDGSPVPGAEVCAFDVDRFWWWYSKQQVGCATTNPDGAFEIRFRWCCGWGPWWWWSRRHWVLDPGVFELLRPLTADLPEEIPVSPTPDLTVFAGVLGDAESGPATGVANEVGSMETIRPQLVDRLPSPPVALAHLWPWRPWWPWWDCSPDIVFTVTQDCGEGPEVVLEEGFSATRWNVSGSRTDVLTVDGACCIQDDPPPDGECMVITRVCDDVVDTIGGNLGAPVGPAGYKNPGVVSVDGDRPYANVVPVDGIFGSGANADYYEFEVDDGSGFDPMLPTANGSFVRRYFDSTLVGSGTNPFQSVPFAPQPISGRFVYESREHYEAGHAPASWGTTRWWVTRRDRLFNWLTKSNFDDGEYRLRVRAWQLTAPNTLGNDRVLPICGTEDDEFPTDNFAVIRLDNRVEGDHPTAADHPCGSGTVHGCWKEPDTDIIEVRIGGTKVNPCDVIDASAGGSLEIDFLADDPDGHLAYYSLIATYGENGKRVLFNLPGADVEPLPTPAIVPAAVQVGPNYAQARTNAGFKGALALPRPPATAPTWRGGAMRYTLSDLTHAFPVTCAYQLELRAYKRTIVSCNDSRPYRNLSEYSITVQV